MESRTSDVIVVGGGIMGTSAAYFLRTRGVSVTLLERGLCGQQASGVNFGNVRRQGRALAEIPLANRAREIWSRLPELVGDDCEFMPVGHLRVCYREEIAEKFASYAADVRVLGLELEVISRRALRERFPYLGPEVVCGSYSPIDGHANPRLVSPAFARAAKRLGAAVHENTEVLAIAKAGDDFEVETASAGRFRAPMLLLTAGAWGGKFSAAFGEPAPLAFHGPQMSVTEPTTYSIAPSLGISTPHDAESVYLRQIPRGNVIMGGGIRGPADPATSRAAVLPANTLAQFTQVCRLVPALRRLRIIRVWSGVESYLPDELPIMGPSTRVPGLYYAFGFCGHGFQIGPGVGDVMAELMHRGHTTTPIAEFSMARFQRAAVAA